MSKRKGITVSEYIGRIFWQGWAVSMTELPRSLGAVFGWCWFGWLGEYEYCLLYWRPASAVSSRKPCAVSARRMGYWSGFKSRARGIHGTYNFHSGRWRNCKGNRGKR